MATASAPVPAITQGVLVPAGEIEYPLDSFPIEKFNRLIPTETIRIPTDLLVPVVQVVRLTTDDLYHSDDMKAGQSAPNRTGLRKLATAAGITVLDQRRTDDGANPDICEMTTVCEMLLPTGQRIRATGVKRIDLNAQKWSSTNAVAHRAKFKAFFQEHVASRSENRAIRSLLSLRGSYLDADLRKPFAVVSFVPNMNHPEIRARILDSFAPALTAGFGPEPKQLPAATQEVAAAEDDVVEGTSRDADPDPEWFAAAPTSKPAEPSTPRIIEVLRDKAEKSGMPGEMTEPQKAEVRAAFSGGQGDDAIPFPIVAAGLRVLWGIERAADGKLPLTAAQAQAIIGAARDDDFRRLWVEAFGSAE